MLTINNHKWVFKVLRLAFGVNCAPGIVQRKFENIKKKIDYVGVFINDEIISANSESKHSEKVECVLESFYEHGIRLNKDKLKFMVSKFICLGHKISQ